MIEQITKQLYKLVEVVKVMDLNEGDHVERELMLVKIRATGVSRSDIKHTADIFRGQIVDVTADAYTVQLVGPSEKLDAFFTCDRKKPNSGGGALWRIRHWTRRPNFIHLVTGSNF